MSVSLVSVVRRGDEDINVMLKRFKRKVETSGHLIELKKRQEFIKPSLQKRIRLDKVKYQTKINSKKNN